ncbi:MAG: radical SAM protein [Gemmatimonadetes bacterium]|nr:radical SAM protein [Gemmatimonadota bacterium]
MLQVNLGKRCNQACHHCHVDAGPARTEVMAPDTVDACLRVLAEHAIPVLDITGGAPELHPDFQRLVTTARGLGRRVIDRCNLTITQPRIFQHLPAFLAEHGGGGGLLPYYQARGRRPPARRGRSPNFRLPPSRT